jgi:XTP/dITP diphosphohydrolase
MKKYFLSGNNGKYREISFYIPDLEQIKVDDLPEIQSLDIEEIIKAKVEFALDTYRYNNDIIILEDTGLYLNALNGFPGPLIKFMLESIGNEGIFKLCQCVSDFAAEAKTVFGLYHPNSIKKINFYSATISGKITSPKGTYGFGWDSIFLPEGNNKTFGEMKSTKEKNNFSMRYMALNKLLKEELINN